MPGEMIESGWLRFGGVDQGPEENTMEERFAGAWRLAAYELEGDDGKITQPYGEKPEGMLMYDAEGHMAVQIMRPGTAPFAANDRWLGTDEELRAAFEGYIAYYGRYTVDTDRREVTHHVEGSVFPNYIGRRLVRYYEIGEGRLTLSTPPMPFGGSPGVGRLVWVRA